MTVADFARSDRGEVLTELLFLLKKALSGAVAFKRFIFAGMIQLVSNMRAVFHDLLQRRHQNRQYLLAS